MGRMLTNAELTQLLDQAADGADGAVERVWGLVYDEVHDLAERALRKESSNTLEPTILVNELYLKMCGKGHAKWDSRAHFFGSVANAMTQLLIDHARRRKALRRGGDRRRVPLEIAVGELANLDIASDDAAIAALGKIDELAREDQRAASVVRLRFLLGLSVPQTAAVLEVSERTVKNDWAFARAWLKRAMEESGGPTPEPDGD